jgi:hypothetical protein
VLVKISSSGGGDGAAVEELLIRDSTPQSLLAPSSLGGDRSKAPQLKKSEDTVKQETNDESDAEMYIHERSQSNSKETDTDSEKHTNAALTSNIEAILQKYEKDIDSEKHPNDTPTNNIEEILQKYEKDIDSEKHSNDTPTNKTGEILQNYEHAILQLQRELGVLRHDYIDRTIKLSYCDKRQTDVEELENTTRLMQDMKDLETKARGMIPRNQQSDTTTNRPNIKILLVGWNTQGLL